MNTKVFDPNAAAPASSGIFGLPFSPEEALVVLLPVPFDATTSYRAGTAQGPAAILEASRQVDLFDRRTGRPYESGIALLELPAHIQAWNAEARKLAEPIIASGGDDAAPLALERVNALSHKVNTWVEQQASHWMAQGKIVGVLGGDHSTPYGSIAAHAKRYGPLGILHIDAHADLRPAYEGFTDSHASIMYNVCTRLPEIKKLTQVGIRDFGEAEFTFIEQSGARVSTFFDIDLKQALHNGKTWKSLVDEIVATLPQNVYVSFDIDGLDPMLCPHTGTPVPGGLSFSEALSLLEGVYRAGKRIVGFDLNEVAPGPAGDDWDGNVGARLLYQLIGWTLKSRLATGSL